MNWLWTNTFPRHTFTEGTIPIMTCRKNLCGQWLHDWVCYCFMQPKSKSFYCFESSTSLRCWEINAKWQQPFWLQPVVGVCLEQRLFKTEWNEPWPGHAASQSLWKYRWDQQWGLSLWAPHITLGGSTLLRESKDAISIFPAAHNKPTNVVLHQQNAPNARRWLCCPFTAALASTKVQACLLSKSYIVKDPSRSSFFFPWVHRSA